MNQRSVFWNLLLMASVVAACVSLLTTGVGLARYLPVLLAWPLALAVQMGLFGLAWLIAVRHVKVRALVIALYCLTMPFSVVFSYVMLQSEFTAEIRPQESQRGLFDDLRQRSAAVARRAVRATSTRWAAVRAVILPSIRAIPTSSGRARTAVGSPAWTSTPG